ncbi:Uncharacterised protein [Vibrio cholerae]|nr:Uncharacterised protein [Vibrio cholerae]
MLTATKQGFTIQLRQRLLVLEARNQIGVGDKRTPECD